MSNANRTVHVNLKRFDLKKASEKTFNAVVIGKRNTGKSVLIAEILYYLTKQKVPRACVFSATEESNRFFCNHIPDSFIFDDSDVESKLELIVQDQRDLMMKRQLGKIPAETDLRIVIVLDDIGYNKGVLRSKIVKFIFMNGRHYDIIVILAAQHVMQLTPDLRSNCDYVVCLKESNSTVMRNLYTNFFGIFEKPSHFKNAFDACTQNYGCMVLNNTVQTGDVNDVINWYKATPDREFKLGSKEFWNYHDERYVSVQQRFLMNSINEEDGDKTVSSDGNFVVMKRR
jgi:hypothetical protein